MPSRRTLYGRVGGANLAHIRALSPAAWYQPGVGVTGTLAASAWADQSGNGRDLLQATGGNQPIYLPYTGTKYGYLPGVASNYFSTPDAAANQITGDITIDVQVALDDWTPAAINCFASKRTAGQKSWNFGIDSGGLIAFSWSVDGAADAGTLTADAAAGITDAAISWIRVSFDVSPLGRAQFYKSSDGSAWTQIGSDRDAGSAQTLFNSNTTINFGGFGSGANQPIAGKAYRLKIYNAALGSGSGTAVVDFNASDWSETSTNGATQVSSTTGETWTLNNTGSKPAQIVGSPQLLFDGAAHFMTSSVTLAASTVYLVGKQISWTATDTVLAGNVNGINIFQSATTPRIRQFAGIAGDENANLAVGSYGIVTAVFNGASSVIQVNATAAVTSNAGTPNETVITLGAAGGGGSAWANWQVKEIILRSTADDAATRLLHQQYLAAKHGITL